VTQPAFSRRIRMLEEWVGTALVDRGSHPVELTQAGQAFLPRAKEVLDKLEEHGAPPARQAPRRRRH